MKFKQYMFYHIAGVKALIGTIKGMGSSPHTALLYPLVKMTKPELPDVSVFKLLLRVLWFVLLPTLIVLLGLSIVAVVVSPVTWIVFRIAKKLKPIKKEVAEDQGEE